MMKLIRNEKGIALVMALIIAFIGLAMVSALLFMVTQGSRISGFQRVYRSTDEAGLGGAQIATQFIISNVFNAKMDSPLSPMASALNLAITNATGSPADDLCLREKLKCSRGTWDTTNPSSNPTGCDSSTTFSNTVYYWPACSGDRALAIDAFTIDPTTNKESEDFKFNLPGATAGQTFTVYAKIVDTVKGNTEEGGVGGGKLGGSGVVSTQEGQITPPPTPTLYRIEVQAQDAANPQQKSKYSVLYAY